MSVVSSEQSRLLRTIETSGRLELFYRSGIVDFLFAAKSLEFSVLNRVCYRLRRDVEKKGLLDEVKRIAICVILLTQGFVYGSKKS